ncbi:MAG: hypothetical protein ACRDMU_04265 [Gaiellaceae bacterium]
MQTQAQALPASLQPVRVEPARAATAEPRGSAVVTAFYLVAAAACLAVVVAAAFAAAL